MRGMKSRDVWKAMHERNVTLGLLTTAKPVAPTSCKVTPPDPCEDCHNLRGALCGGVKLTTMSKAERTGCVIRYW